MSSVFCAEKLFVFFVILISVMMFGEASHARMKGYVCAAEIPRTGSGSQTKSPILHGRLVSYSSINPVISKSNICLAAGAIDRRIPIGTCTRNSLAVDTSRRERER